VSTHRASKRNFASRNKTVLGPRRQTETSLKIEDMRSNKTTGKHSYAQQPEFWTLSTFYIINFLNKLNIVENIPKNENKIKIQSRSHRPLLGTPGTGRMYRLSPPLIFPVHTRQSQSANITYGWGRLTIVFINYIIEELQISSKNKGPGGSMSLVVGLPNNSYKPITNTAWVRSRLCKLQKRMHSTRKW
jgi:hypothetical protein